MLFVVACLLLGNLDIDHLTRSVHWTSKSWIIKLISTHGFYQTIKSIVNWIWSNWNVKNWRENGKHTHGTNAHKHNICRSVRVSAYICYVTTKRKEKRKTGGVLLCAAIFGRLLNALIGCDWFWIRENQFINELDKQRVCVCLCVYELWVHSFR